MGRKVLIAVVVAVVAVAVAVWELGFFFPRSGPLAASAGARVSADRGDIVTLAFMIPNEKLERTVDVVSVEPFGVVPHVDVIGTGIGRCDVVEADCVNQLSYERWPPRGVVLEGAEGVRLGPDDHVFAVVGIRMPDVPSDVRVRGVRLSYRDGWRRYRAEVGPDFVVRVR